MHLRKFREREGAFLVEGADLVAAGCAAGLVPQAVFVRESGPAWTEVAGGSSLTGDPYAGAPVHPVTDKVAARLSTLESPADVAAVFAAPQAPAITALAGAGARATAVSAAALLIVYADRVADPGNMGTLVRAAAGFGAAALATSPGSVDLLSPKVVRASMGAVFGLPLYQAIELGELLAELEAGAGRADDAAAGAPAPSAAPETSPAPGAAPETSPAPAFEVFGLVAHGGDDLRESPLPRPAVLCVGAERAGLSPAVEARLTHRLTIPLAGGEARGVESLNAGVAGAIALYEFSRRPAGGAAHDPQGRLQAPGEG